MLRMQSLRQRNYEAEQTRSGTSDGEAGKEGSRGRDRRAQSPRPTDCHTSDALVGLAQNEESGQKESTRCIVTQQDGLTSMLENEISVLENEMSAMEESCRVLHVLSHQQGAAQEETGVDATDEEERGVKAQHARGKQHGDCQQDDPAQVAQHDEDQVSCEPCELEAGGADREGWRGLQLPSGTRSHSQWGISVSLPLEDMKGQARRVTPCPSNLKRCPSSVSNASGWSALQPHLALVDWCCCVAASLSLPVCPCARECTR